MPGLVSDYNTKSAMTDLDLLQNAEFKEAFDEFDKVRKLSYHIEYSLLNMMLPRMVAGLYPPRNC